MQEIVVSAVPADNWRMYFRNDDGKFWSTDVIAWAITNTGRVIPLSPPFDDPREDSGQIAIDSRYTSNFVALLRGKSKHHVVNLDQTELRRVLNDAWMNKQRDQ